MLNSKVKLTERINILSLEIKDWVDNKLSCVPYVCVQRILSGRNRFFKVNTSPSSSIQRRIQFFVTIQTPYHASSSVEVTTTCEDDEGNEGGGEDE